MGGEEGQEGKGNDNGGEVHGYDKELALRAGMESLGIVR